MSDSQLPTAPEDAPLACATGKIRLCVEADLGPGAEVPLHEGQAHYLRAVMRCAIGAPLLLFNGRDGEWSARLTALSKKAAMAEAETLRRPQDAVPDLTLLFAPVKKAPMDFLVQKAVELGVARLAPVLTRRTIVSRVNTERIRAQAVEAAEQCGRLSVPAVAQPARLDAVLEAWPSGHRLLFCDEAGGPPALETLRGGSTAAPWSVLIGPEGGFDGDERARLIALPDALSVSLGPRIMRADTAALAALTLWQAALGDLGRGHTDNSRAAPVK